MKCALFACTLSVTALLFAGCGAGDQLPEGFTIGGIETASSALDSKVADALVIANVEGVSRPQPDSDEMVALGEALFFDKILSGNQNISCATCHHPTTGTSDFLPVPIGEGGSGLGANRSVGAGNLIPRNAPHVFNAGVSGVDTMFWDSRLRRDPVTGILETPEADLNGASPILAAHAAQLTSALAAQAMFPVTSHDEMRGQPGTNPIANATSNAEVWSLLMARLVGTSNGTVGGIQGYRDLFDAAYPSVTNYDDFNFGHAARAIAAFERTRWTALDSPFDRYVGGDMGAMSDAAKRGAIIFCDKGRCAECHNGPLLSDFQHHVLATPQVGPGKNAPFEDLGRALETGNPADEYAFRTPQLRNIALTAPYMHSGAFLTLEAAVRHHLDPRTSLANYDPTQLPEPFESTFDTDPGRNAARSAAVSPTLALPIGLTDAEFSDLMAFLHALTDPSSLNQLDQIPDSVPSGLPVKD